MFSVKIKNNWPTIQQIEKNIRFGTARGLTWTAKDAAEAIRKSLGDNFTLRGQWFQQSNKYGIRPVMATKEHLQAKVTTAADWLILHEEGGVKTPTSGSNLAIPTENVRRNKRMIIPRGQRPAALRNKRTFVLPTRNGKVLFERKGRGKSSRLIALYNLEPRAQIKKRSTFYGPGMAAVRKFLQRNVDKSVWQALNDIK